MTQLPFHRAIGWDQAPNTGTFWSGISQNPNRSTFSLLFSLPLSTPSHLLYTFPFPSIFSSVTAEAKDGNYPAARVTPCWGLGKN